MDELNRETNLVLSLEIVDETPTDDDAIAKISAILRLSSNFKEKIIISFSF